MEEARRLRVLRQHVATDGLLGLAAVPITPGERVAVQEERDAGGSRATGSSSFSSSASSSVSSPVSSSARTAPSRPSPRPLGDRDASSPPPAARSRPVVPDNADKADRLEAIRLDHEQNCDTPLRNMQAPGAKIAFGEGDPDADLMFVGEGPGETEARLGRPFVGPAGELLDKMIVAMGLTRQTVYIANAVKFRPPNNRAPNPEEIAVELPYLEDQIEVVDPKVIVVLGGSAAKSILKTRRGIMSIRGQWHDYAVMTTGQRIPVMPTYHPAFLLRQYTPDNRKNVWADLQAAMQKLAD